MKQPLRYTGGGTRPEGFRLAVQTCRSLADVLQNRPSTDPFDYPQDSASLNGTHLWFPYQVPTRHRAEVCTRNFAAYKHTSVEMALSAECNRGDALKPPQSQPQLREHCPYLPVIAAVVGVGGASDGQVSGWLQPFQCRFHLLSRCHTRDVRAATAKVYTATRELETRRCTMHSCLRWLPNPRPQTLNLRDLRGKYYG